jgi:chromosomal replication initiation ATPase DnaA
MTQILPQQNSQQVFAFEPTHNYAGENFLVAPNNREAFNIAITFPWHDYALNIFGENGCGKTHIAQIAKSLTDKKLLIIDEPEKMDEVELLQKLNIAKEDNSYVLITSDKPLSAKSFSLPDLTSRLAAINSVAIERPTEELFYMLLSRQFTARQIIVDDAVLNFLTNRLERNFSSLIAAVEKIDRLSLQEKRSITIPLVKSVIDA